MNGEKGTIMNSGTIRRLTMGWQPPAIRRDDRLWLPEYQPERRGDSQWAGCPHWPQGFSGLRLPEYQPLMASCTYVEGRCERVDPHVYRGAGSGERAIFLLLGNLALLLWNSLVIRGNCKSISGFSRAIFCHRVFACR